MIRVVVAVLTFVIPRFFMRPKSWRRNQWLATLFAMICIWSIFLMILIIGDPATPYYVGLILVTNGLMIGLRVGWSSYAFIMLQANIPFLAYGITHSAGPGRDYFWLNLTFVVTVNAVLAVGRLFHERLHERARFLRDHLQRQIVDRDKIIEEKTAAAMQDDERSSWRRSRGRSPMTYAHPSPHSIWLRPA